MRLVSRSRLLAAAWPVLTSCGNEPGPDAAYTSVPLGAPDRGLRLIVQYQCARCHDIPQATGTRDGTGPSLAAFGRRSYIAGHVPNVPPLLQQWLESPQTLVPGAAMPDLGVSQRDARDMAAYLMSLR